MRPKTLNLNFDTFFVKKIDKKSIRGRMIFCKPFVPRTPQKEDKPSDRNNENPSTNLNVISIASIPQEAAFCTVISHKMEKYTFKYIFIDCSMNALKQTIYKC